MNGGQVRYFTREFLYLDSGWKGLRGIELFYLKKYLTGPRGRETRDYLDGVKF